MILDRALQGERPDTAAALAMLPEMPLERLIRVSEALTLRRGALVTYSPKVFIPLTRLCRDVCHYCTFATAPAALSSPYLSLEAVLEIARRGSQAGCREALFTLGDKPELRYPAARRWLDAHGYATTLDYVEAAARAVLTETGLLPHLNPGVMDAGAIARLRLVSASMGLMLETSAGRLGEPGQPHWGSPDKLPALRLETLRLAGELQVPFTTGLLIGIGETRRERIEALCAIRDLDDRYGHIEEVIIQNFRAKPGTRMANTVEPTLDEQVWTIAAARVIFGSAMSLQAPPNLRPEALTALLRAGIDDWGGISPVTPDHVNPEAPWPEVAALAAATAASGRHLAPRLAIGPRYALDAARWLDPALHTAIMRHADVAGLARDSDWHAGSGDALPPVTAAWIGAQRIAPSASIARTLAQANDGTSLSRSSIATLLNARGRDVSAVVALADTMRREVAGDQVTYVFNRNINYTNICLYHCGFCAFSKGSTRAARGAAYRLDLAEIAARAVEARQRGATEVCLQGGIHPSFNGDTYLDILGAVRDAAPELHVHAFSPLEVTHGARTLGLSLHDYLGRLRKAGLSSLPGTAAEILDDEVRALICPDKLTTAEWLDLVRAAHETGLRTTATMMFGHVDRVEHWARHLEHIRALQAETGGFTEFVPLPFVHMEAPMWQRGRSRSGPTLRETVLVHAVARIVLHRVIPNIQASWVKLGANGAALCLAAGVNDLGGVLMDESITRAAGGVHGQQMSVARLEAIAATAGRPVHQRTTLYGAPPALAMATDAR